MPILRGGLVNAGVPRLKERFASPAAWAPVTRSAIAAPWVEDVDAWSDQASAFTQPITRDSPVGGLLDSIATRGFAQDWGSQPFTRGGSLGALLARQQGAGFDQAPPAQSSASPNPLGQAGSGIGQASGEFGVLNQYDQYFQQAAQEFGLDPDDLKAIAMIERGWEGSGTSPAGAVGIMQVMPQYWGNKGYDIYNPQGNIMAGALAYKSFYDQYADQAIAQGMDPNVAAARAYLAGNPWSTATDAYGTSTDIYGDRFTTYLAQLEGQGRQAAAGAGVGPSGQSVVGLATQYVGVQYVWGGIPGKGQDPRQTGWDCSGMTYWLDQNYGNGQLPMGSHYQYDYAVRTGQLATNTGQLQAGDLVFFDTGLRGGGGAELNGASHVGVYIGDGKMLHAANPSAGTIISDFNSYTGMYPYLGSLRMPWSGQAAGQVPTGAPQGGGGSPAGGGGPYAGYQDLSGLMRAHLGW